MAQYVRDVMTGDPVTVEPLTSVTAVARLMRDRDLGAVLVTEGDRLRGLVIDRDLVVRSVAEGRDLAMERDPESALGDISVARPNP
ncbi:CBS domain-containing protein [Streptomyces sp. NPDC005897]|uniref:CBS domain-containing protein n=1 Tax=Streptomyces sp. NPDC005897 TaxID=3157081 RepID=UPI0033FC0F38